MKNKNVKLKFANNKKERVTSVLISDQTKQVAAIIYFYIYFS